MSNKTSVEKCNKFKNNQYVISEDPPHLGNLETTPWSGDPQLGDPQSGDLRSGNPRLWTQGPPTP